ncbi:MAG: hypothetical protein HY914_21230 [Desulfomonile tiedjei]|nr:hypothetical protein [Desulfomonile tiedjei]
MDVMAAIGLIVLAVLVIGSALLLRNRSAGRMESSTGEGSFAFKDCYELCGHEPGKGSSGACNTMCSSYGGA